MNRIRQSVSFPAGLKFNKDPLMPAFNTARYVIENKGSSGNITYPMIKQIINDKIYDLALDYICDEYLKDAPNPNIGLEAPLFRPGVDVHTLFDTEKKSQAVFEESKSGAGLRYRGGRFKRFR